jgi:hypothetical protein
MASASGVESDILRLSQVVEEYRPRRSQRYSSVHVLLLVWEDGEAICHEEAKALSEMFRISFNYDVKQFNIPTKDSQQCLVGCVGRFVSLYGRAENLIVVHYGGHGGRPGLQKSPFTWAAYVLSDCIGDII